MIGDFTRAAKGVEMLAPQKDRGNATLITLLSFIILERWALPLFKAVGLVPENNQAAARTDIACAPCEVCSHHVSRTRITGSTPSFQRHVHVRRL